MTMVVGTSAVVCSSILVLIITLSCPATIFGLSLKNDKSSNDGLSRGDFLNIGVGGIGAVAYGKLIGDTLSRISRGIAYPKAHEDRVRAVILKALTEAAVTNRPLRVLEVGIGTDCRLIRRGLYDDALESLASKGVHQLQFTGIDIDIPSSDTILEAKQYLEQITQRLGLDLDLNIISADLTAAAETTTILPLFGTGAFDAIICCLTLCSVSDPDAAVLSIQSLLRPNGGTLGFVEHVAVNTDETYRFLNWQQQTLDPLQQLLADNCHLHRNTQATIDRIFGVDQHQAVRLYQERFLVDDMWPVSCQCSGVIQRTAV
jgi:SAM-dependent methyltransferase